jgi:hypothetical protein
MQRVLAVGLSILLSGCGLGSMIIKSESVSFGDTIEDTTNKLLVTNVLRARDKAPLHFADIPVIRETITQSASLSFLNPMGPRLGSTQRDILTGVGGLIMTPSFDINHLHSKEFITGITSPIDPKIVKYWLDRGLDRRIVLLLFFSAVEIIETRSETGPVNTIRIANSPREAVDVIRNRTPASEGRDELRCDTQSDFERYLKLLNTLRTFFAHSYKERRLLAGGLKSRADADGRVLQALTTIDPARVQVVHDKSSATYSLYLLSGDPKVAFCFYDDAQSAGTPSRQFEFIDSGRASASDKKNCFQSIVEVGAEDAEKKDIVPSPLFFPGAATVKSASAYCGIYNRFTGIGASTASKPGGYPKLELKLYIRSVGEIFQFLGDLLHYQEEVRKHVDANPQLNLKLNAPITFGYCGDHPEPGCDDIFLRLDGDPCNARFTLAYRDQEYRVANFDPPGGASRQGAQCRPDPTPRKDHTLEILSVLHQLVGLNKFATDVRSTPSVHVLP